MGAALAALAMCLATGGGPVRAQGTAADKAFFNGKTISYVVATKPGGGYDTYARLIAPLLEKHLPGVRVRIDNVPGAGHLVGLNQMAAAKADGLTIATFNTGLIYSQLLRLPGMQVDLRKLSWIGKAASDPRILLVSIQSGIASLEDLRTRPVPALFASAGVGSAAHNETLLLADALGFDAKIVPGFGGGEAELAMMRGEIQALVASYSSLKPFIDAGNGRIVLGVGGGTMLDDKVPAAIDVVGNGSGRGIVTVMHTLTELGRLTAGPAGMPPARLAALREAYDAALADPQLLASAEKLMVPVDPLAGAAVAERISIALDQPDDVIAKLRALSIVEN